jgi:DNA sulfur modification protein DndB
MSSQKIKEVPCDDLEQARKRAEAASGAIGGITIPVSIFAQGSRRMLAGALPIPYVAANLVSESARPRSTLMEVESKRNRPMWEDHVEEIGNYLVDNVDHQFILPPMTLNVKDDLILYTFREEEEIRRPAKAGFLVVVRDTQIDIADGQHRKEGIKRALDRLTSDKRKILSDSSVAVMLTCETELPQIHQDFADCSKTKPISPSQLAVFDRRNPTNALVLGLVERCELFRDKLDTTSSKLGAKSAYPFITNQVRQVVKVFISGSNAEADDVFEAKAKRVLQDGASEAVKIRIERYSAYLNQVTRAIPEYHEIAVTPAGDELKEKLSEWRRVGYVSLVGTGLIAITRVLYELLEADEPDWQAIIDRMGTIDWKRTNPEWSARVVTPDKAKVNTGYAASMAAAGDIKRMIEWGVPTTVTQNTLFAEELAAQKHEAVTVPA